MAVPVKSPVARSKGHGGGGPFIGLVVMALCGLGYGAACSAAESVGEGSRHCTPLSCVSTDPTAGPPDGASLCPKGVCNYQTGEGCSADQTCAASPDDATATVAPKCVAVGLRKAGEPCDTSVADATKLCARGLQCIGPTGTQTVCRKLCCAEKDSSYGDWRACDKGESCIRQLRARFERPKGSNNFVDVDAEVSFCVPVNNCDPLDATSCASDKVRPVCRIADPIGDVACMPPGTATLGEPCQRLDQCGPVEICAQTLQLGVPQTDLRCRRLCRPNTCGDNACPESEGLCVHFLRDPAGVGECTPWDPKDCAEVDGSPPTSTPHSDGGGARDASIKG